MIALFHIVWLAENDVDRTPRRFVARNKHRHNRRGCLDCHPDRTRLRAHMLVSVAARALDEDHHFFIIFERLHALVIGRSVVRGAVNENDPELFHDPADDGDASELLFCDDPAHLRRIERQQQPDRVRTAGVVHAENGLSRRDELAPHNTEHRMPEKQADPADPPADPVPERHHPSFLLMMARISETDCSMVFPEVSSFTASGAGFRGAIARSESCLSRCFMSCKTFS